MKILSLNLNDKKKRTVVAGKIKKIFRDHPGVRDVMLADLDGVVLPALDSWIEGRLGITSGVYVWFAEQILDYTSDYFISERFSRSGVDLKTLMTGVNVAGIVNYLISNYLRGVVDWLANVPDAGVELKSMDYMEAASVAKEWHDSLQVSDVSNIEAERDLEVLMKFPDGHYWLDLGCSRTRLSRAQRQISKDNGDYSNWGPCDYEADMMGHCGSSGGVLYSLRKDGVSSLTASVSNNILLQMKGRANTKPLAKYHPYIIAFLTHPDLELEQYECEYLEPADFSPVDIKSPRLFKKLEDENPRILSSMLTYDSFHSLIERGFVTEDDLFEYIENGLRI